MPNRELLLKKLRLEYGASDNEIRVAYEKLKHTYELVAMSTNDEDIKHIAEGKLRELESFLDLVSDDTVTEISYEDEYAEIVKAVYKLLEHGCSDERKINNMLDKLKSTTFTAENYYLQTLLYLELNNGYPGCVNAKATIENAIVIEPENEAYLALKHGIDSVIQAKVDYDEKQLEIQRKKLEEERARAKSLEEEAQRERRRAVCGEIFQCMCNCIGGLFQCICSCCSCCDDCC